MMTISEFKLKYPMYGDMSDEDLADKIHSKYYSDVPRDQFDSKAGVSKDKEPNKDQEALPKEEHHLSDLLNPSFQKKVVGNIPSSAGRFAADIAQPFIHPLDTAENFVNLGKGVMQKTGILSGTEYEQYPEAVGKFMVDRYGSVDDAMRTFQEDPVGVMADISMIFTGGGAAAARMPGLVGRVGEIAKTAGRATDPLNAAGKLAAPIVKPLGQFSGHYAAEAIGDIGTYTGGEPIRLAAKAGYEGGEKSKNLTDNMRSAAKMEETTKEAEGAVAQIGKERGRHYRSGMADLSKDKTVLTFDDIDKDIEKIDKVQKFGDETISKSTEGVRSSIKEKIDHWKELEPEKYHTPEGMDALKRTINEDIRKRIPQGKEYASDRKIADDAYNAVKSTIVKQSPEYAKIMKGYEEASDLLQELEKTLSINPKATVDTTLRKLQSVLRNNVNTSYGRRKELAQFLVENGAPHLMEKLAGQALSSWAPRGMGRTTAGLEAALALMLGSPHAMAGAVPLLAASSPRIVGEVAHGAGVAARGAEKVPVRAIGRGAFQAGRLDDVVNDTPLTDLAQP